MSNTHILSALIAKRAELAGKIEATQLELRQFVIDIDNVDATIRLFDPEIDLEQIRPKPLPARNTAFRGEVTRTILNTLRESSVPMSAHDLALHVMAGRALSATDKPLMITMTRRVLACLRHNRKRNLVRSVDGPKRSVFWEIVR